MARFLALVIASLAAFSAHAQNASPPPGPLDYAPVRLVVGCGEAFQTECGKVLPGIAAKVERAGLVLEPTQTGDALRTVSAVCSGAAAAAIVQHDAAALAARDPTCNGRAEVVGRPLFPVYALMVVRADAAARSFDGLMSDARRTSIAAGPQGSGGQITLGFLLRSNPAWQRNVDLTQDDTATALQRIGDRSIDGLFTTEALESGLIDRVRLTNDVHGKPLYRVIDIRPGSTFSQIGDGGGHCLYRTAALDFGGTVPVTTVSVDAVMLLGRGFRDAHARGGPRAADALASAMDAVRDAIPAEMKPPGDWRPTGASCQ